MQITSKELYNKVSEENNLPLEVVKFVGDSIFKEWNKNIKEPSAIILKIKKLGRQYLRRNRLIDETKRLRGLIVHEDETKTEQHFFTNEERKEIYDIYSARVRDYYKYVSKKREVQKKRYPNQPIIPKLENSPDE